MSAERSILHVDMDAFFAAIEQLDNPELRGKPILVGHDGARGVVSTASYEARPFGCHSAQPMAVAKRMCPQAIVVPVRFERYNAVSSQLLRILEDFSPMVQPISIDEAFVDLTGTEKLLGNAIDVARRVKNRVKSELKLTASVGVAPNKFLAKLASDLHKPDGLTVITPETIDSTLLPLPVTKIWGIGPKTAKRLAEMNIRTIADMRRLDADWFETHFGVDGGRLHRLCYGKDERTVTPDSEAKSISQEHTFGVDAIEPEELRRILLSQVESVAARLRRHHLTAGSIRLKIRDGNFKTVTRSRTLDEGSNLTQELWKAALEVFDGWARESFRPVRLLGFAADGLTNGQGQMGLFTNAGQIKSKQIDSALDQINSRFGASTIRRAGA